MVPISCPSDHIERAEPVSNGAQAEQVNQSWRESVREVMGRQKVWRGRLAT